VHGDYHLGQVLYTGRDFVIIDFEGEPARPLSERRIKRSPLRDVAGMLRSYHYVSYAALFGQIPSIRPEDFPALEPWAKFWYTWVSVAFLKAYLTTAKEDPILPKDPTELQVLLEVYLLEKAVYELGYELNNRPEWVKVPVQGLLQLLTVSRSG
jgi:maltose alpha-D-glucosyltransferase / alpha-amylase